MFRVEEKTTVIFYYFLALVEEGSLVTHYFYVSAYVSIRQYASAYVSMLLVYSCTSRTACVFHLQVLGCDASCLKIQWTRITDGPSEQPQEDSAALILAMGVGVTLNEMGVASTERLNSNDSGVASWGEGVAIHRQE